MRFRGLAILALVAALAPVSAHAGLTLGGFYCQQKMVCDQYDANFPAASTLVPMVTACVGQNTGVKSNGQEFFDPAGVDSAGCFTTNAGAFPESSGGKVVPHCCVTQAPGGNCAVYCTMASQ